MQINTELETTQFDALSSSIQEIVKQSRRPHGITAREAIIHLMESTTLLPGVFNVQMLSWRQKLQDLIHNPRLNSGFSSLQYTLPLSIEISNGVPVRKTVGTQTTLCNPNSDELLEFHHKEFHLKWTLLN